VILRRLLGLNVSCHIAGPSFPFHGRVRETRAKCSSGVFGHSLAAVALFNNGVAAAAVILASLFGHEDAFMPFS
jgi:hypothetical protein